TSRSARPAPAALLTATAALVSAPAAAASVPAPPRIVAHFDSEPRLAGSGQAGCCRRCSEHGVVVHALLGDFLDDVPVLDDLAAGHAPDVGDGHAEVAGLEVQVAVGDD